MSLTERPISAALKTMLVNNEPVQYAHLIKFERPSRPDSLSGLVSTSKQRYTYLTDASRDVDFDDGSIDLQGVANGTQTYLANKVLKVGSIQEQTKATTSTTTLVLDGNALGAQLTATGTIALVSTGVWNISFAAPLSMEDILAQGFREGDKITVNNIPVNIQAFTSNTTIRVTKIDTDLTPASNISITLKVSSEEIISILLNKNAADYASFINREIFIYRAYFRDGQMVGSPVPLFKGIINNVNFEDSDNNITVTWGISSHWGDFSQVRGRVTSDTAHRALDESGVPQPSSALKPIYAYDKGFIHSETSVNMLAKYVVQVEKPGKIKSKKGFLGIGAKVKVKNITVAEDRFTNLDLQLQAKAVPVIYGVRKAETIPIFADTLKTSSSEVYIAAALSEGEIGGIYDVYIDGNSLICNDKADSDARSVQSTDNTVELICRGRADRGDALGGEVVPGNTYSFFTPGGEQISIQNPDNYNYASEWGINDYAIGNLPEFPPVLTSYSSSGIIDGQTIRLTSPQKITLDFFSGKAGQKASAQLSKIAFEKNFKIQDNYWTSSNTYEYWGPNHRLLDTAYVVGKFIIEEGETTIPEMEFVVRGKVIDCYNYDYSYLKDRTETTESADNFVLGETVSLFYVNGVTETLLNSNVQIIDKWTFKNPDGTDNVRFRFDTVPALNIDAEGKPQIKKFYMKDASNNKWTMTTFNYNILGAEYSDTLNRLFIPGPVAQLITGASQSGGNLAFSYASNDLMTIENDPINTSPQFQVAQLVGSSYESLTLGNTFPYAIMVGTVTNTSFVSQYPFSTYQAEATQLAADYPSSAYLVSKDTVRLPAQASATPNAYVGDIIEITRYNSTTGKTLIQSAEIVGYNAVVKVATIDGIWDFIPTSTDTVRIYPKYADSRVSINPAIQTMDYLTSKVYGRGLDPYKDINLSSVTETARRCDVRSDVTILTTGALTGLAVNDKYRYPASGNILWQGTVLEIQSSYVTFTDNLGKFTNKWNSWKTWQVDDVLYYNGNIYRRTTSAGINVVEPTHTGGTTVNNLQHITSLSLTKVSGSGPATVAVNLTKGNPVQGIKNGQKISGYSLYDCDDIDYWRLSGWDGHDQRYVTRNQCNITIDTSVPLFENTNGLLEHYNGILRYTAGKYYLDTEEFEPAILTTDIRTITADDIIGKIQLSDDGIRSAFNSLTAAFADPANKFEARNISFFNSDYLKADRNVPKKGNLSVPGITNYYNTRLLADGFLNKSRFGLTISMTVRPEGLLYLAGTVIQVIYPRYDWGSPGKKFRIESVTYQPDGLVDIVAKEYDDSFYSLSNIRRNQGTGATIDPGVVLVPDSSNPSNLVVSQNQYNQILLQWNPGPTASSATYTEIWRSNNSNFANASIIALVPVAPGVTNEFVDKISPQLTSGAYTSRYYWIRRKIIT
jgi:hypothetical protein